MKSNNNKRKTVIDVGISFPEKDGELLGTIAPDVQDAIYIVFDIETTGGNPHRNGITEICAFKVKNNEILDTFYSMVNPKVRIPSIVRKMTGITNQMVKDAPLIEEVMPQFVSFIGKDILVSHNILGDLKFIRYFAKKAAKHNVQNFYLCTHLLAEKLIPESKDKSLQGLATFLGAKIENAHRADVDTEFTLLLLKELIARISAKDKHLVSDAIRMQGDLESSQRIGWAIPDKSLQKMPNKPGLIELFDKQGKQLFVSSSENIESTFWQLQNYGTLPKKLLKLLVKASQSSHKVYSNIYQAMYEEVKLLGRIQEMQIPPSHWHLRYINVVCIAVSPDSNDEYILSVGHSVHHAKFVFGPVNDLKMAQSYIKELALKLNLKFNRKGILFPKKLLNVVVDSVSSNISFKNYHIELFKEIKKFLLRNNKDRVYGVRNLSVLQEVKDVRTPERWKHLLHKTGIVVVFDQKNSFQLYPVANSYIYRDPLFVRQSSFAAWMAHDESALELVQELNHKINDNHFQNKEKDGNDLKNCPFILQFSLWMIFGRQKKLGHEKGAVNQKKKFVSLDELNNLVNES